MLSNNDFRREVEMTRQELIDMAIQAGWHGGEAYAAADALKSFAELLKAKVIDDYIEAETKAEMKARGEI